MQLNLVSLFYVDYSTVFKDAFISVFVIFFRKSRVERNAKTMVRQGANKYVHQLICASEPKLIKSNTNPTNNTPTGTPKIAPIKLII